MHLGSRKLAQPLHAVARAALQKHAHASRLLFGEGQHHRSVALIGKAQLACPSGKHPRAFHVEAGFERSGHGVIACMDYPRIGPRRPARNIVSRLDHAYAQPIARKLARNCGAGNARADHDDIVASFSKVFHVVQLTIYSAQAEERARNWQTEYYMHGKKRGRRKHADGGCE